MRLIGILAFLLLTLLTQTRIILVLTIRRPLEPERTRAALRWLVAEGQRFGVERIFVEPYLAARLGVFFAGIGISRLPGRPAR
jgi:hypothetical protein